MGGGSSCCEGDPPNEYQNAFLQQEAKYSFNNSKKIKNNETCNFHSKSLCDGANRLIHLLYNYRIFMSRYLNNNDNINLTNLISDYKLSDLETDFNHIINIHINNKIFMSNFIESLSSKNNYKKCNLQKCDSYQRIKTNDYYKLKSVDNIRFINELDHIHKYFEHLFSFQFITKNNHTQILNNDDLRMDQIEHKHFNENDCFNGLSDDEIKDNDDDNDNESISSSSSSSSAQFEAINTNTKTIPDYHGVGHNDKDNNKFFSDSIEDKSKRFYYWDSYEDDDRRDTTNGGKYSDWYVSKKHENFKAEIEWHSQDIPEYSNIDIYDEISESVSNLDKSKWKINDKSAFGKKLINKYGLNGIDHENISNEHLIALKAYYQYPLLRDKFIDSLTQKDNQSIDDFKDKHSNFYHFGKYLRESVECFGKEINNDDIIYHGINDQISYSDPNCSFISPTMCIINGDKNKNRLMKKDGMVIKLKKNKNDTLTYFDFNQLFENENENEYKMDDEEALFIGGLGSLKIIDIKILGSPMTKYINGITIISDLIHRRSKISIKLKSKNKQRTYQAINEMIKWKLSSSSSSSPKNKDKRKRKKRERSESDSVLPQYIKDLFNTFCLKQDEKIIIDLDVIQTTKTYISIKDNFIFEIDTDLIMVKLIDIIKLFQNVSIIEIKHLQLNDIIFDNILDNLNKLKSIHCKLRKIIFSDLEIMNGSQRNKKNVIRNWEYKYMNNGTTLIFERQFVFIDDKHDNDKNDKQQRMMVYNNNDNISELRYCERCKALINGEVYREKEHNHNNDRVDEEIEEIDLDFLSKHPLTKIPDDVWIKGKLNGASDIRKRESLETLRKKKVVSDMKSTRNVRKQKGIKNRTTASPKDSVLILDPTVKK